MTDLAEILHNIADHTETFYRFLSEPGVAPEIKARLIDHIVLEETENTARLSELHGASPTPLTQKMLDHSFILQKVMNDATMPQDLKQELLHHFMEEHAEWQTQIIGTPTGHAEPGTTAGATVAHQQKSYSSTNQSHQAAAHHQAANTQQSSHSHGSQSGGCHGGGHGHSHSSNRTHESQQSKPSNQSGANQPETREWTVGPMWNQGD